MNLSVVSGSDRHGAVLKTTALRSRHQLSMARVLVSLRRRTGRLVPRMPRGHTRVPLRHRGARSSLTLLDATLMVLDIA